MKIRAELSAREIEAMYETIQQRLGDSSVPTLPQVAMKIVEKMGDENASMREFGEVIQTDQALTGRLLRMANSAYFAQRKPVTTIDRAMVLMGIDRLKALALGFHLSKAAATDAGELSFKTLWTQSLFRGWLALRLAERFDKSISGEAFIIGLMSDAGLPMMPKLLGDRFIEQYDPDQTPMARYRSEFTTLPYTHVDVSAVLCRLWKLPELLSDPIGKHHEHVDSIESDSQVSVLRGVSAFVNVLPLNAANARIGESFLRRLAERLFGLDVPGITELLKQAAEDFKSCQSMFGHLLDQSLPVDKILERAAAQVSDQPGLVAEADNAGPAISLDVAGMTLECEPAGDGIVTVFITDRHGHRLISEQIDPERQPPAQIRQLLLLDDAKRCEIDRVVGALRDIAA